MGYSHNRGDGKLSDWAMQNGRTLPSCNCGVDRSGSGEQSAELGDVRERESSFYLIRKCGL